MRDIWEMRGPTETVGSGNMFRGEFIAGDAASELKKLQGESVDLVICSPPYNIGKMYEKDQKRTLEQYLSWQEEIISMLPRLVKSTGSVCWQVGTHVKDGAVLPLDIPFFRIFEKHGFILRNRIVWRFNFGHNSDRRFSGRYETILWFTKSDTYKFNLDPVRVPQLYPGKRHGKRKLAAAGLPSGNPLGKNPSDYWEFSAKHYFLEDPVWDIPNIKANHPERTNHPCQYPIELAERCVLALTDPMDFVLDPFVGSGSSIIAAAKQNRIGLGIDKDPKFVDLANERLAALCRGDLVMRPSGIPVRAPVKSERVAKVPDEWVVDPKNPGRAIA